MTTDQTSDALNRIISYSKSWIGDFGSMESYKQNEADCIAVKQAFMDLQPGWQPIETAPKDGTYILANQTGVLEPSMVVVSFDEDWSADGWWMCCDGKNPELPLRGPEPTHWMPLPQPPQEGSHE